MQDSDTLDINLGKYIETLFRQWRLIVFVTLICAITAAVVGINLPKLFEASALVATTKSTTEVSFDTGIETLSEEELTSSLRFIDPKARLQSYVQIIQNPDIAQQVMTDLGKQLPEDLASISELLKVVEGDVAPQSDLIAISVTYTDPELAAEIANAWAAAYVAKVNQIYLGGETEESFEAIQRQTGAARDTYDQAQADYVAFLNESKIAEYHRQMDDLNNLVASLTDSRSIVASEIISGTARTNLIVFEEQFANAQAGLASAYEQSRKVESLLQDAQDMRDQVRNGGTAAVASNTLALTLLKAQIFADNEVLAYLHLQSDLSEVTQDEMLDDLNSLITTLEARQAALDDEIQTLSSQLLVPGDETGGLNSNESGISSITSEGAQSVLRALAQLRGLEALPELSNADAPLEQELQKLEERANQLNALLASEQDRELELMRARDLAWSTYEALARKEAEMAVALQTRGTQLALASPATIPTNDTVSVARNVLMAALVGFFLGVFAAYAIEFWWAYKGIEPRPVTLRLLLGREKS